MFPDLEEKLEEKKSSLPQCSLAQWRSRWAGQDGAKTMKELWPCCPGTTGRRRGRHTFPWQWQQGLLIGRDHLGALACSLVYWMVPPPCSVHGGTLRSRDYTATFLDSKQLGSPLPSSVH